jgi:hypothetical protein
VKTSKASKPKKGTRTTQADGNSFSPIKKGRSKPRAQKWYGVLFLTRFREEVESELDALMRELAQGNGSLPEDELR